MAATISIIVLTCDSYTHKFGCIEHTLLALVNQKAISKEIIVVNNGVKKLDRKRLENFVSTLDHTRLVSGRQSSIATARNIGSQYASADILLFVDDDTIVLEELALIKINDYAKQFTHGYGANRWWTLPDNWFAQHSDKIKMGIRQGNCSFLIKNLITPPPGIRSQTSSAGLIKSFIGNFGFITAEAFKQLGGFPTQLKSYGFEDTILSFLCYLRYGKPALLHTIQLAHVYHPITPRCVVERRKNKKIYTAFLHTYGYKKFCIDNLLYRKLIDDRPILEPIEEKLLSCNE